MPETPAASGDEQTERVMGSLLIFGVALAAAVVLLGAVLYLMHYGTDTPNYGAFRGEPADLPVQVDDPQISALVRIFVALVRIGDQCERVAVRVPNRRLGLLILIGTPVARVVFSVFAFVRQRDLLYTSVTLTVLSLLIYSLVGGKL